MVANKEGQRVPQVVFHTRSGNDWKEVSTDDLFAGKTVVLFALPGAFTLKSIWVPPWRMANRSP